VFVNPTKEQHQAEAAGPFWAQPPDHLLARLETGTEGLSEAEAARRLQVHGYNRLEPSRRAGVVGLLLSQFRSPIILLLIFAAGLSLFLGEVVDATSILIIVLVSGLLGFWQEKGASDAVDELLAVVRVNTTVLRNGSQRAVPLEEVVPGNVTVLSAGDSIPADCRILGSSDLHVDEATLTGESYPVEKEAGDLPASAPLAKRTNCLFMGTHVVSGTAMAVVAKTGKATELGEVSERLRLRPPETEFERGLRRFGYLLVRLTLLLALTIFAVNVFFERPVVDSFLFSLALAVGLTPQLLPAITSVTLSHGARRMAREKVIVKRLASIENFGSMDVLCSDKTGTITEGRVRLHSSLNLEGEESERVFLHAYLNASFESGYRNPIDETIRTHAKPDISGYQKIDEVPYDFVRKRLSILVSRGEGALVVTKGALENVLAVCPTAELPDGTVVELAEVETRIKERFEELSGRGFRVLGVAYRNLPSRAPVGKQAESAMTFSGFVVFEDPPKGDIVETVGRLRELGCSLKIVTGDNRLVARSVAEQVGLPNVKVLTGGGLHRVSDSALSHEVSRIDVFAEVEPNQKERIILALKKGGSVVGYIGDGINDAPALHAADVGISVDGAADVAKEAADIVLLEKDLGVLAAGVGEGRATFANTLKYIFITTSANFGNMFSMAGLSLLIPFLPLLPKQILLINFLTDFPAMTIATDSVDKELVDKPRRWSGVHTRLHGHLRSYKLRLRLLDLRCPPHRAQRLGGRLPYRLVRGIGRHGATDAPDHPHPETLFQEQRRPLPTASDSRGCLCNRLSVLYSAGDALEFRFLAGGIPPCARVHRGVLRHGNGDREEGLLRENEVLI
jgi:Mg2+-importing ATPase